MPPRMTVRPSRDRCECKRQAWRNIVCARDIVAIKTDAIFQRESLVDRPLVLEERSELGRVPIQRPLACEIDLFGCGCRRARRTRTVLLVLLSLKRYVVRPMPTFMKCVPANLGGSKL